MAIKIWSTDIAWVYVWGTLAQAVYVGDVKVRPSSSWDMSKWTLAQTSSALSGTWWEWISFKPDGTRMYLVHDGLHVYSLNTPFDISQFTEIEFYQGLCYGDIYIKPDWTKAYWFQWGSDAQILREYTLNTPWDFSTATETANKSIGSWACRWVAISNDGTKFAITTAPWYNYLYQFTCSTPWTLSTWWSTTRTSSAWGSSCAFWKDGTMFFKQINESVTYLTYWTLTTPYNAATLTSTWTKTVWQNRAWWIWFNQEWTMCFIVWWWNSTNYVTKYTL